MGLGPTKKPSGGILSGSRPTAITASRPLHHRVHYIVEFIQFQRWFIQPCIWLAR